MRTMKLVVLTLVLVGAMGLTATHAAAEPVDPTAEGQYHDAMWYFLPVIGQWSTELKSTLQAAEVKPELACGREMYELANRGEYMVYDLQGTPVPASMVAVNAQLMNAMSGMSKAAKWACGDAAGAGRGVDYYRAGFDQARQAIRAYLTAAPVIVIGLTPAQPVVGK